MKHDELADRAQAIIYTAETRATLVDRRLVDDLAELERRRADELNDIAIERARKLEQLLAHAETQEDTDLIRKYIESPLRP